MIRNISIDGFKSLSEFHFEIKPGLNVLVGANGSGKTTIIKAFEFLSNIIRYPLSDAISRSGGAGEVFDVSRHKNLGSRSQFLNISCSGDGVETRRFGKRRQAFHVKYNFSARIMFDPAKAEVAYVEQSLEINIQRRSKTKKTVFIRMTWKDGKITITRDDETEYTYIFGDEIKNFDHLLEARGRSFQLYAITTQIFFYRPVYQRILRDIYFGNAFNIIPENVKKDEDIASTPQINPDGSGLAATLFHVTRSDRDEDSDFFIYEVQRPMYDKNMLKRVNDLLKLVNTNISDLTVTPNYAENKLAISACIKGNGEEFRVPLRYLSDGTVKWLALSAAILSKPSVFILEEPENFLHPRMLSEAIELMRSTFLENKDSFTILSSHSETLINLLKPSEIVVVSYVDGKTKTGRLTNSAQLHKQINKTGFGLGWYFVANALEADQ